MVAIRLLIICFLFSYTVQAQDKKACNCVIHGEVIDKLTNKPIVGAVVLIKELNKGIFTDETGHYHLGNVCHGKYSIECRIVGYEIFTSTIDLNHTDDHEQDFSLSEDETHLEHIEIKAEKITNATQSKQKLQGQALDQTRGETLAEALTELTGVSMLQTGSSIAKPVVHGMHSNRVLLLNNGLRQEGQQWGSEHAPEIDPFVAKKLTLVRGALGVRYGSDAIAGVILVEADPLPDSAKLSGEVNVAYFTNGRQTVASSILQGKVFNKLGWRTQGTFKRGGNMHTPTYNLANTGVAEYNFSVTTGYESEKTKFEGFYSQFNTKIGIFAGSHIGNITDLVEAIKRPKPLESYTPETFSYIIDRPYQDVQHSLQKINIKHSLSSPNNINFSFGRQYNFRREVDVLRGDRNLAQTFRLTTYSSEIIFEHAPIAQQITGMVGLSGSLQQNLSTGQRLTEPRIATVLIPNFKQQTGGVFLIERLIKPTYEIELGARYDVRQLDTYFIPRGQQVINQNSIQNKNWSGTVGLNLRPNQHLNLLFNTATAWRAPNVNELFSDGVHHGSASFEQGNAALKPEVALNTSATVEVFFKAIQAEFHFYANRIEDYIFLAPSGRAVLTIRGAFPEFRYTQTLATFRGFDFTNQLNLPKAFKLQTKISYLQAYDQSNQQWLIMIPANRLENKLTKTLLNNKLSISLSNLYVAQQKRIPVRNVFKIPASEIVFTENGGDFLPPPLAYSLWSAAVGFKPKNNVSVIFNGSNLLNIQFRDYLNRFRYFTDDIGRNISLKLKVDF